jgi:diguanylate cyclase (GGDEF)-like protein
MYVYSRYGREILANKYAGENVKDLIVNNPVADIYIEIEGLLELFRLDDDSDGIILTENGRYAGFLTTRALLKVIYEKTLSQARDQNPLTKFPGNQTINEYIQACLIDDSADYVFAYFDFDHFKPFNDTYGFRHGDRAILLFADILKEYSIMNRFFVGHIGGDDFIAGVKVYDNDVHHIYETMLAIQKKFREDIASLYSTRDRERACIVSKDRTDTVKKFSLMRVSVALLTMRKGKRDKTIEEIGVILTDLKKQAKLSDGRISLAFLDRGELLASANQLDLIR